MENEDKKEYKPEEFAAAYEELCRKYGYAIMPELGYKQQIDGTFTISIKLTVIKPQ